MELYKQIAFEIQEVEGNTDLTKKISALLKQKRPNAALLTKYLNILGAAQNQFVVERILGKIEEYYGGLDSNIRLPKNVPGPRIEYDLSRPISSRELCKRIFLPRNFRILIVEPNYTFCHDETRLRQNVSRSLFCTEIEIGDKVHEALKKLGTEEYDLILNANFEYLNPVVDSFAFKLKDELSQNSAKYAKNNGAPILRAGSTYDFSRKIDAAVKRHGEEGYIHMQDSLSYNIKTRYLDAWIKRCAALILSDPLMKDKGFVKLLHEAVKLWEHRNIGKVKNQDIIDFTAARLIKNGVGP